MKSKKNIAGFGLFTAFTASICCITPVLASLAGIGGITSAFSWIDPLRPYLIALTLGILGFAWYKSSAQRKKNIECGCEPDANTTFWNHRRFLTGITLVSLLMLFFPSYSSVFFSNSTEQQVENPPLFTKVMEYKIDGMTCSGCEQHVINEVNKVSGVIKSQVSYDKGNAIIEFDPALVEEKEVTKAISRTGYKITEKIIQK